MSGSYQKANQMLRSSTSKARVALDEKCDKKRLGDLSDLVKVKSNSPSISMVPYHWRTSESCVALRS